MEAGDWKDCDLVEIVPGKHSGDPVFKNTRLPVEAITGNVDSFIEIDGLSLDEAIAETLACFPDTPGGADGIRAVLNYRAAHENQPVH
jgi:uncharacterized protein (DUF433 family)